MDRRAFLKTAAGSACLLSLSNLRLDGRKAPEGETSPTLAPQRAWAEPRETLHEASYYEKRDHKEVQCLLCPRKSACLR